MSIKIENVSVGNPGARRLDAISTCFEDHSITICVGMTGSGKSTLLDTICGLTPIADGSVLVDTIPLWNRKRLTKKAMLRFGSVFQYPEHQLFARNVKGEFDYSLRPLRLSKAEINKRIRNNLTQMDLPQSIVSTSPFMLSGGQKRRVALATTFATLPDWLLLDEPTAGLDFNSTKQLCEFIQAFKSEKKSGGVIIATHDLDVFLPVADNIVLLHHGKIIKHAPVQELYLHPEWLTKIGIAFPSTLTVHASIRQTGWQLPARHLSPKEMASIISQQLEHHESRNERPQIHFENLNQTLVPKDRLQLDLEQNVQPARQKSHFSNLDPRTKWLLCIVLSAAMLFQSSWDGIFASIGLTGLVLLLAKVSLSEVYRYSKSFMIIIALSMLLSALQFGKRAQIGSIHGFGLALHPAMMTFKSLAGILCVTELGLLLSVTTSTEELKQALSQLLSPIRVRGLPIAAFILSVSLLLRFIPMILGQLERFSRIARARGKRNTKFGQIRSRDIPAVVIPLLISVLKIGEDLSQAMEARGFKHANQPITQLRTLHMKRFDWLALACTGVIAVLLVILHLGF